MDNFKKVYRVGTAQTHGGRGYSVYVKAEYTDGRLSISGVEGPLSSGNAVGACGQIDMHLKPTDLTPAPGWTIGSVARLLTIWGKWHLNDMRPGCAHQMETYDLTATITVMKYRGTQQYWGMARKAESGTLTLDEYAKFRDVAARVSVIHQAHVMPEIAAPLVEEGWIEAMKHYPMQVRAIDVRAAEHPEGLLCKPCEVCGNKYGASWIRAEVPEAVLQELKDFPDTDRTPAWV